jgi:ribosomal protein L3 glutamine methyltransferase
VEASDLSAGALAVARKNIDRYKLRRRVKLVRSNLFANLTQYDLIVSNPPYVTDRAMRKLPQEYQHEPALALAAGKDGLDLVRRIIEGAKQRLKPGGLLVCEIGGGRKALERAYPRIEFAWPETSEGAGSVFILAREQLPGARAAGALRTSTRSSRGP